MSKMWQYMKTDEFSDLNDLGLIGWELVAVTHSTHGTSTFYLKREYSGPDHTFNVISNVWRNN